MFDSLFYSCIKNLLFIERNLNVYFHFKNILLPIDQKFEFYWVLASPFTLIAVCTFNAFTFENLKSFKISRLYWLWKPTILECKSILISNLKSHHHTYAVWDVIRKFYFELFQKVFIYLSINHLLVPFKVNPLRYNTHIPAFFPNLETLLKSGFWYQQQLLFRFFLYLLNRCKTEWFDCGINVIALHTCFVTSYGLFQQIWNVVNISWAMSMRLCFCLKFSNFRTTSAAACFMPKTSVKIAWH